MSRAVNKILSDIKPGDLVRVYDYTHKRRAAMPSAYSEGHKVGLIVREYPEDSYFPDDYEQFGDPLREGSGGGK